MADTTFMDKLVSLAKRRGFFVVGLSCAPTASVQILDDRDLSAVQPSRQYAILVSLEIGDLDRELDGGRLDDLADAIALGVDAGDRLADGGDGGLELGDALALAGDETVGVAALLRLLEHLAALLLERRLGGTRAVDEPGLVERGKLEGLHVGHR